MYRLWHRVENAEINTHICSHWIFDRGAKNTHGERIICSINGAGKIGYPHVEEKLDPYVTPCTKIRS